MAYIKTNWQSGDVISAEKLNKIEDGITSAYTTATSAEAKADSLAESIIDFNNLETVEELGENDKVLVSSGGSVKEADATLIGGGSGGSGNESDIFMVEYRYTEEYDSQGIGKYERQCSSQEVIDAINSGKYIFATTDSDSCTYGLVYANISDTGAGDKELYSLVFNSIDVFEDSNININEQPTNCNMYVKFIYDGTDPTNDGDSIDYAIVLEREYPLSLSSSSDSGSDSGSYSSVMFIDIIDSYDETKNVTTKSIQYEDPSSGEILTGEDVVGRMRDVLGGLYGPDGGSLVVLRANPYPTMTSITYGLFLYPSGGENASGMRFSKYTFKSLDGMYEATIDGDGNLTWISNTELLILQWDENHITTTPEELLNFIKANQNVTRPLYVKNMSENDGSVNLISSMFVNEDETFFYVLSLYASIGELGYEWVSWSSDDPEGYVISGGMTLFPE